MDLPSVLRAIHSSSSVHVDLPAAAMLPLGLLMLAVLAAVVLLAVEVHRDGYGATPPPRSHAPDEFERGAGYGGRALHRWPTVRRWVTARSGIDR